jgi:hypothetical protein
MPVSKFDKKIVAIVWEIGRHDKLNDGDVTAVSPLWLICVG